MPGVPANGDTDVVVERQFFMMGTRLTIRVEAATRQKGLAAVEAFLISGDPRFRQQYREAYRAEERATDHLRTLLDQMDAVEGAESERRSWDLATRVGDMSFGWNLRIEEVLNEGGIDRGTFLQNWDEERGRVYEIFSVTRALREALSAQTSLRLGEIGQRRDLQALILQRYPGHP